MITIDYMKEIYPDIVTLDGFDDCMVGTSVGNGDVSVVYDSDKIINKLVCIEGMTVEDANEHFEYNILGLHVGVNSPSFIERILQ
jgi:hypothetical protein